MAPNRASPKVNVEDAMGANNLFEMNLCGTRVNCGQLVMYVTFTIRLFLFFLFVFFVFQQQKMQCHSSITPYNLKQFLQFWSILPQYHDTQVRE